MKTGLNMKTILMVYLCEALLAKCTFAHLGVVLTVHWFLSAVISISILLGIRRRLGVVIFSEQRGAFVVLSLFFLWTLVASISTIKYMNIIFACLMIAGISVGLCVPSAYRLGKAGGIAFIGLCRWPLFLMAVASLLYYLVSPGKATFLGGRLSGVYANATYSGHCTALGLLIAMWYIVIKAKIKRVDIIIVSVLAVTLALTGTRSAIGSVIIAVSVMFALFALDNSRSRQGNAIKRRIGPIAFFLPLMMFAAVVCISPSTIREFFRISDDVEGVLSARSGYMSAGYSHLDDVGVFGVGFMSKWAEVDLEDRDPHSTLFLLSQQIGMIGACLFFALILYYFYCFSRHRSIFGCLGVTVVVFALARMFGENALASWGDPTDRFCWVIMGVSLSAVIYDNSASRRANPSHYGKSSGRTVRKV